MNTLESEIRELTVDELDLVSGGAVLVCDGCLIGHNEAVNTAINLLPLGGKLLGLADEAGAVKHPV
jgi:hypothetical protein